MASSNETSKENLFEHTDCNERPFLCCLCRRDFASKQVVLNHLYRCHERSPVKRVKKRYLDDSSLDVPSSTQYRWKKRQESLKQAVDAIQQPSCSYSSSLEKDSAGDKVAQPQTNYTEASLESSPPCSATDDTRSEDPEVSQEDHLTSDDDDDDIGSIASLSSFSGSGSDDEMLTTQSASESCSSSQDTSALSLLACFLRHNMSASACKDVIKSIKALFPQNEELQQLDYEHVWKSIAGYAGQCKESHYCPVCSEVFPDNPDIFNCATEGCLGLRYKGPDQNKNGRLPQCKFVFADIKSQLQLLLESPGVWKNIQGYKREIERRQTGSDGDVICDITDGTAYRALREEGGFLSNANNLTSVMNTDGVNLYSSSKVELWPIFLALNELSPGARYARENILLAGIWQGKGKPPFQKYMDVFSKEVNAVKDSGVNINVENQVYLVKLSVICLTLDLPAKASVLNMTYFNGSEACITCEEPGKVVQQGRGHSRCYPYRPSNQKYPTRTCASVRDSMQRATPTTRVNGFRGSSGLVDLHGFNFVNGIVPDYMHGVLLGVTKTLLNKWFAQAGNGKPFFVGKHLPDISKRLKDMSPPDFIERLPRDLEKHYSHLKATELQTWLLFYCVPCMRGFLPDVYLKHVAKLSEATHILLGDSITPAAIARARQLLDDFYKDFEVLYGQGSCGLNVHNVGTHLVFYVQLWGPMWAWSCFAFEDANAMLLQSVHGTGDVVHQVLKHKLAEAVTRKFGLSKKSEHAWSKLTSVSNCEVAGKITKVSQSSVEKRVMDIMQERELSKVQRIMLNGCKFYSVEYTRMKKRECSVIRTDEDQYGKILLFVLHNNTVHAVLRMFELTADPITHEEGRHLISVQLSRDVKIIPAERLRETMIYLHGAYQQVAFISTAPNKHGRSVFK